MCWESDPQPTTQKTKLLLSRVSSEASQIDCGWWALFILSLAVSNKTWHHTGIETLTDYRFKFGRSALLEGGLAINPSGCARCEAKCRTSWRRAPRPLHTTAMPHLPAPPPGTDQPVCPYTKQFIHTKSSQYKKMKMEWRNNVYLAR